MPATLEIKKAPRKKKISTAGSLLKFLGTWAGNDARAVRETVKAAHTGKYAALRKKLRALDALLEGDPREQRETFK